MLTKSFSLTSVVTLSGIALFVGVAAACGGSDDAVTPADAGSSGTSSGSDDAGTGQGTSGGTSSGGTSSGGVNFDDAGLTDPSTVDGVTIPFTKCPEFTKCEGSIKGNWKIVGGCLPDTTFDQFKTLCPDMNAHDVIIKASGTVDATESPNTVAQKTSIFLQAQVDLSNDCIQKAALFLPNGCDSVPGLLTGPLANPKFDHAVCKVDGDTCKCKGDVTVKEDTSDQYTTDKGVLSTGSDPKRTYDYCPKDGKITYHETTEKNKSFGMFLQIGPK